MAVNTPEAQEIFKLARERAVALSQESISSELLLDAIIRQKTNSGVLLLETANTRMAFLRGDLQTRLDSLKVVLQYAPTVPKFTAALATILGYAAAISPQGVDGAALIHAMYMASDSAAGQILRDAGYCEAGEKPKPPVDRTSTNTPALNSFSKDLTKRASEGKLDPVIGRTAETSRLIEILARRKKNNPLLIGEPGVGKSSIIEGLAISIVNGTVPEILKGKRVISLELNSIVSGTKYRGQFEERMKAVLDELRNSNGNIICFIDEIHTLIGNGGTEGTGDAAQIIKPALSSGEIRCIGATTMAEYRKHIETDGALDRRFQRVTVDAPTMEETKQILGQIKGLYESFHTVTYTDDAIDSVLYLTERYISDRQFPDKAIDVMDEAGAVVALANNTTVQEIDVQKVIAKATGIPVTSLSQTERQRLKTIETDLSSKVVGQDEAIKAISCAIKRAKTGLKSAKRPSSFLFLGPTGTGKTETAKQLAKYLFDREESFIRIDMSEFGEKFNVSGLIGAPPGYVGYGESGKFEQVKRHPYSIVLLDEIEKAHPDVYNIFLQILDDGFITDASGRKIDFKNTIMIFTSNVGVANLGKRSIGIGEITVDEDMKKQLMAALKSHFKPEFLNRLDSIVTYKSLDKESIKKILGLYLSEMGSKYTITLTDAATDFFVENGYSLEYGARPLRRLLENEVEVPMADLLLDTPDAQKFTVDVVDKKVTVAITQ